MRLGAAPLAGCVVVLASCVSPVVIDEAVLSYDRALSRVRSEVLLLNVARARAGLPLNATEVTALTATFEFEAEAELGGGAAPIGGPGGPTGELTLGLSTRALEAPTLSIVPLQGEAFTRRLLEPTSGATFEFLHHRGVGVGLLLRLLGQAVVLEAADGQRTFHRNDPGRGEEFDEFRRRVHHLAALAATGQLEVGPIRRREELRPRPDADLEGVLSALERGFDLTSDAQGPLLTRVVDGRLLIADYDPDQASEDDRRALQARALAYPDSFLLVDVRADAAGGRLPFRGWIKLRSLQEVLEFVARGIDPSWERPVAPHPATPRVAPQPARTLVVNEATTRPDVATVAVELHGRWYWLAPATPGPDAMDDWNLRAFQVLTDLYHLTTRTSGAAPPVVVPVGGGRGGD